MKFHLICVHLKHCFPSIQATTITTFVTFSPFHNLTREHYYQRSAIIQLMRQHECAVTISTCYKEHSYLKMNQCIWKELKLNSKTRGLVLTCITSLEELGGFFPAFKWIIKQDTTETQLHDRYKEIGIAQNNFDIMLTIYKHYKPT